jgi:hypothetical protein
VKIVESKAPNSYEGIKGFTFQSVGYVVLDPYLKSTNPKYSSEFYENFTLVVKGSYVKKNIEILKRVGYKTNYANSITLVSRVKVGYEGEYPVRNLQREIIETSKIVKGSRVFFGCCCSLYETHEGEKRVQFNLKYVRYLEKYLGEEEEEEDNELGQDTGPEF